MTGMGTSVCHSSIYVCIFNVHYQYYYLSRSLMFAVLNGLGTGAHVTRPNVRHMAIGVDSWHIFSIPLLLLHSALHAFQRIHLASTNASPVHAETMVEAVIFQPQHATIRSEHYSDWANRGSLNFTFTVCWFHSVMKWWSFFDSHHPKSSREWNTHARIKLLHQIQFIWYN